MNSWKIRFLGIALMVLGGFLFVWSVRDITAEWPQIFVGLLSVFSTAMGFGLLIMPLEDLTEVESENNLGIKKIHNDFLVDQADLHSSLPQHTNIPISHLK